MRSRVHILDGLRVVAILMVMFFHYYSFFYNRFYTYAIDTSETFKFGYLGVELFFIISGFVITLTLTSCNTFWEFLVKRFIRLLPGMLICSLTTFLICIFFDINNLFPGSKEIKNLILSNTFVKPDLLNFLFKTDFEYIDAVYWSLWVELCFYIVVATLYFLDKTNLLRNFGIFAIVVRLFQYFIVSDAGATILPSLISQRNYNLLYRMISIFDLTKMALWFLLGMLLLELHRNTSRSKILVAFSAVFLLEILLDANLTVTLFSLAVYVVLLLFIYKPAVIAFLGNKFLTTLGIASYSIYLIHNRNGLLLIDRLSPTFGVYNIVLPIIAMILACLFAFYSYKYFEMPAGKWLKKVFVKKPNK